MVKELHLIRGYVSGVLSGMTWGLDTVILGVAMAMTPFVENKILMAGGAILVSALHDVFSSIWIFTYMVARGRVKDIVPALRTRDGRFCALAAVFGGPLAMTFYVLAIATGGASLTANVTAIYPLLGTTLAVLILKEKTGIQTWVGLVLCVLGIFIIGYTPSDGSNVNVLGGVFLALVAAIGWATEGVVCGYGMRAGTVDPLLALLIREMTSGLVYILIVTPIILRGFVNVAYGTVAIFSMPTCGILIAFTALIGMMSFGLWYTAIDNIGASKALCLNVTYSMWSVAFTFLISLFAPQKFSGMISPHIILGSIFLLGGVSMASLYKVRS